MQAASPHGQQVVDLRDARRRPGRIRRQRSRAVGIYLARQRDRGTIHRYCNILGFELSITPESRLDLPLEVASRDFGPDFDGIADTLRRAD